MIITQENENANPFYHKTARWIGKHFGVDGEAYGKAASIQVEGTERYPTFSWDDEVTAFNIMSFETVKISGVAAALVIVIYALQLFGRNTMTDKKLDDLDLFKDELLKVDGNAYMKLIN